MSRPSLLMWHERHTGVHNLISASIRRMLAPWARSDETRAFSLCSSRCHSIGCLPHSTHWECLLMVSTNSVAIFLRSLRVISHTRDYNIRRQYATATASMNGPRPRRVAQASVHLGGRPGHRVPDAVGAEHLEQAGLPAPSRATVQRVAGRVERVAHHSQPCNRAITRHASVAR